MNINTLVPIAVTLVVAFFVISIGSVIMDDAAEEFCSGTMYTPNSQANASVCSSSNPLTSDYWGCCTTVNASTSSCTAWSSDASINASYNGLESLDELASWGPTLALVIIAAIIIGVLVTYLAKGAGGSV